MIRRLHNYEIHGSNKGPYFIRQGERPIGVRNTLREARAEVYALARGDARRMVTGFQGQRELELTRSKA